MIVVVTILAPDAGVAHAAPWRGGGVAVVGVDPDDTGLDAARHAVRLGHVARPDRRALPATKPVAVLASKGRKQPSDTGSEPTNKIQMAQLD